MRLAFLAVFLLAAAGGASAQAPQAADDGQELAFGLNRSQFVDLTGCSIDAVTEALASERGVKVDAGDVDAVRRIEANMLLIALDSVSACVRSKHVPLAEERVEACFATTVYMPLEAPKHRKRGAPVEPLAAAWSSFVPGEPERSMLAAWTRKFYAAEPGQKEILATGYHLAQCATHPGASIELDMGLVDAASKPPA